MLEKNWLAQITPWRRRRCCGTLASALLWHIYIMTAKEVIVFVSMVTKTPPCLHGSGHSNAITHLRLGMNWEEGRKISHAFFSIVFTMHCATLLVFAFPVLFTWTHIRAGEQEKGAKNLHHLSHLGSCYKGYLWAPFVNHQHIPSQLWKTTMKSIPVYLRF